MDDNKFMRMAILKAGESNCKKVKHGAVIIDEEGILNGSGCNKYNYEHQCTRMNIEHACGDYKDCPSVHAEVVAICNTMKNNYNNYPNDTMYITGIPCISCAKMIGEMKIGDVVILSQDRDITVAEDATLNYFTKNNVKYRFMYVFDKKEDKETANRRVAIEKMLNDMFNVPGYKIEVKEE